jgi:hypothetical protein
MSNETETPRTDAVQFQTNPISLSIENEMLRALSRKLERELAFWKSKAHEAEDREGKLESEVVRLKDSLHDCLSFLAFHGPVGATPDTAMLLQKCILATLQHTDK